MTVTCCNADYKLEQTAENTQFYQKLQKLMMDFDKEKSWL